MPSVQIRVYAQSLRRGLAILQAVEDKVQQGRPLLIDTVHRIGQYWAMNYQAEGSYAGGWVALADRTQRERERQGYDPQHPILQRSGSLMQAATSFAGASDSFTGVVEAPYSKNGVGAISYSLLMTDTQASLQMHGYPVINQWGDTNRNLPQRAFWFSDRTTHQAALDAMQAWAENIAKEAEKL